jgi:hypothetical protein
MVNLSQKEIKAIDKLLDTESKLIDRFKEYCNQTIAPELKIQYQKIVAINQNSYNKLLNLFNG